MATQNLKAVVTLGGAVDGSFKSVTGSLNKQLGSATKSVKGLEREQAKLNKEIKKSKLAGANVDILTNKYDRLGRELDEARRKQKQLSSVSNFGGKLKSAAVGITAIGASVVAASTGMVASLFAITKSQAEAMDSSKKLADSIGLPIATLQGYQYAAERSGVSTEQLNGAVEKMTRRTANFAQTAGGPAKKALEALGLAQEDLANLSTADKMDLLADRLNGVENAAYRNQVAFEIFGLKGTAMTNMLKDGSKGLKQYQEEANRLGWVLDKTSHESAEGFDDALLDTKLTIQAVTRTVSSELMPVFTSMMKKFTSWASENQETIKGWAKDFSIFAKESIPKMVTGLESFGKAIGTVSGFVSDAVNMMGGWKNILAIIGSIMAAKVVVGIGSFVTAGYKMVQMLKAATTVQAGLNLVMTANPIGLVVAAVGALIYAGYQLYTNWDSVTQWFKGALSWFSTEFPATFNVIKTLFDWSPLGMVINNWEPITGFFSSLWDGITAKFEAGLAKIKGVWNTAKEIAGKLKFWGDDENDKSSPTAKQTSLPTTNRFNDALQSTQMASRAGNQTTIGSIQVNAAPGQSPQEVAQAVHKKMTGYENSLLSDIPQ